MRSGRADPSVSWAGMISAAVGAAAARALLFALQDGYSDPGLQGVAAQSFAGALLANLAVALPASILLSIAARRLATRSASGSAWPWITIPGAAVGYAFITGRLPHAEFHAFGWDSSRELAAHGSALACALVAAILCTRAGRAPWLTATGSLAVVATLAAAGIASLPPPVSASWPERPNVILISLDTLRADRLGCYGYGRPTTPEIDALAARAVRFTSAFSVQPWTLAAHMSLFTSVYPVVHGVNKERALAPGAPTLAQSFRDAGFTTAAVVDNVVWMDRRFGLDRGFHSYRVIPGRAGRKNEYVRYVLDDLGERPFFLFLHYYDAHSDWQQLPYESEDADRATFSGGYAGEFTGCDAERVCATSLLMAMNEREETPTPEDLAYVSSLYDAGVRSLDRRIGELLDELEARGLLERSIVVLTSDHGEEFFEHGMALHYQTYEESTRIPLIVATPAMAGPRVSDWMVSLVDVGPTLMELAGIEPPATQGASFADAVLGTSEVPVRDRVLLVAERTRTLRTRDRKLVRRRGALQLYDLEADPGERADLISAGAPPELYADLERALDEELAASRSLSRKYRPSGPPGAGDPTPALSDTERRALEALGYVVDPPSIDPEDGEDPDDSALPLR